jgi:hypothetical protein
MSAPISALCLIAIVSASELGAQQPVIRKPEPERVAADTMRARRIARVPFRAGSLDAHWSVAGSIAGVADLYADSVVVVASVTLRANDLVTDSITTMVDSVAVGLAVSLAVDIGSWFVARRSIAMVVETPLRRGAIWAQQNLRFVIPLDSALGFDVSEGWPVLEVMLSVPRTADNPSGIAWTYAHALRGLFVRER